MIDFTNLSGLFSSALFSVAVFTLVLPFERWSVVLRCLISILWVCLILIPFEPVSAAAFVRSFIGDLSIPSLVVLFLFVTGRVFDSGEALRKKTDLYCWLAMPIALVFYPLAMGLGKYDPYLLGYGSPYLLAFTLLITLMAWVYDHLLIAFCLSVSVLCYALGWYESTNLWDYLLDPLLAVYATGLVISRLLSGVRSRFRRGIAGSPSN